MGAGVSLWPERQDKTRCLHVRNSILIVEGHLVVTRRFINNSSLVPR